MSHSNMDEVDTERMAAFREFTQNARSVAVRAIAMHA